MREVGYVSTVGRLLDEIRANRSSASVEVEIADHQAWFDWATEYESENGGDSLLNRGHPVHLEVMEIVMSVKDVGCVAGASSIPD